MPHILVLGATGTLGGALCRALLRAGHTVYGLARSPTKAASLWQSEIIPVLGSVESPQAILDTLGASPEITVVVDAAAVYGESVTLLNLFKSAGEERLKEFVKKGVPQNVAPKLGYVYVSGMWVHGSNPSVYTSDANPLTGDIDAATTKPVNMVAWRPEIERLILNQETQAVLDTAIVRPACAYGNTSAIWTAPLSTIYHAVQTSASHVAVGLEPGAITSLIHVDDAGSAISCVIEKLPLIAHTGLYPVFNLVGSVESVQAIMEGAARALGFTGKVEVVAPAQGDLLSEALAANLTGDSSRLRTTLGWEGPKRKGFLQGIQVYAHAWKAGFEAH